MSTLLSKFRHHSIGNVMNVKFYASPFTVHFANSKLINETETDLSFHIEDTMINDLFRL